MKWLILRDKVGQRSRVTKLEWRLRFLLINVSKFGSEAPETWQLGDQWLVLRRSVGPRTVVVKKQTLYFLQYRGS